MTSRGIEHTWDTDVLVIGGGAVGCRAAIAAHEGGAQVTMVLKGKLTRSGATCAPGRGAAYQASDECAGPHDSPDVHLQDVLTAAAGMADERLARIQVEEVVPRMLDLESWGFHFAPDPEGKKAHYTGFSCFGTQPRAHCILGGDSGHAGGLVVAMREQIQARGIPVHEDIMVTDLLVEEGICIGALAMDGDGQLVAYRAKSTVLAVGGARQIFPQPGSHRIDTTGDGYAMALRAGAELANLEFMQFMLGGATPTDLRVPGSFWKLFPALLNRDGERVLGKYLSPEVAKEQAMTERTLHYPFSTRDSSGWLDIAVYSEIRAGRGTDEGGILIDFSEVDLDKFVPSRPQHLPEEYDGPVVLPKEPFQIRNTAHAINGGLRIDTRAESTIVGLFAAGEVAAGPHGADRLGGGMLGACQVFGERAGRFAAEDARQRPLRELTPSLLEGPLARASNTGGGSGRLSPEGVLARLQEVSAANLMVAKSAGGLSGAIESIQELREALSAGAVGQSVRELRRGIEVENTLLVAEAMARAGLMREESRGSFYREDHPVQDDANWRVNIHCRLERGGLALRTGRLWGGEKTG